MSHVQNIHHSYQAVFPTDGSSGSRQKAEIACIESNLRLESDDLVYNAFGIAVAKYLGTDVNGNLRFENLRLESDFKNAKILREG